MAELVLVPGGGNGDVRYVLAPGETWTLDAVVFALTVPLSSGAAVPTLIARSQDGSVIARVSAPAIPA